MSMIKAERAQSGRLRITDGHPRVRAAEDAYQSTIQVQVKGEGVVTLHLTPDGYAEHKTKA